MNEFIDPSVKIWPACVTLPEHENLPELTGADWNALVMRVKTLEAANHSEASSTADSRS